MKKELVEKIKNYIDSITEGYSTRNEYGMSYDDYYYEYLQSDDENDIVWNGRTLMSEIENYEDEVNELRTQKIKRIIENEQV